MNGTTRTTDACALWAEACFEKMDSVRRSTGRVLHETGSELRETGSAHESKNSD